MATRFPHQVLRCSGIMSVLACSMIPVQGQTKPQNTYHVQFADTGDTTVSAELFVKTGVLVMAGGYKPDVRSANVADLRITSRDGNPVATTYDPQQGQWTLPTSAPQSINLSYTVHTNNLRSLPDGSPLQYAVFDKTATYFVTACLFIVPDSFESADPATVTISPPTGSKLAAPWTYDESQKAYTSTIRGLVVNTIVIGNFQEVFYREGSFSIAVVLLGQWSEHRDEVEKVIRASVARDLLLFPGTPPDHYLITLVSGGEDGQSYMTSNAISTRLPIDPDDTEIWANTIAHEFFHHWNTHLIHTLDPRMAFFVEGFTEYYANRQTLAGKLIDQHRYWNMAALHLGAYSYFNTSSNYGISLADAGSNKTKNRFGVYDGGWTVALCLDLELRADHHSLDDVMRLMWLRYGKTQQTYTFTDFVKVVSEVAGHDIEPFFAQYITGRDTLPFRADLTQIGVAAYTRPVGGEAYLKSQLKTPKESRAYNDFVDPQSR